ncbi:MAG: AAA family ATPase [Proteobacteria bacterium]|nr:AAA family ATPase [Pseudomonadota bacterium]
MSLGNEYQIVERLRSGTYTELYRALRIRDKRPVFVKVLHRGPWFDTQKTWFELEYDMGRSLDLPSVLKPLAFESHGENVLLVLEDFGGIPLNLMLNNGGLGVQVALEIAEKAAGALGALHGLGIIHKDIRPANFFYDTETAQLKVAGFGIASFARQDASANPFTQISRHSFSYMSPEQTGRMRRSLDFRTDFSSLGIMLFQCLTGQLPFAAKDELELVHCHLAKEPPAPNDIDSGIPAVVSKITVKLMAKMPEDRYQSAYGLAADLRECRDRLEKQGSIPNFSLGRQDRSETFRIPEKLYGREKQIDMLLRAFERTERGRVELMLVTGYSGVGKSALINELHKPLAVKRGYFITGKCDQYKRHIPYSALIVAFSELVRIILTETKKRIDVWRRDLTEALAPNAQVLIDVVPDLELVIGSQPPVAELPSSESQNRFDRVFIRFLHVLASEERHLVLFLDDLQWIDSSSLRLLHLLVANEETGYLLLLGAYRDNEVDSVHPLAQTLTEIHSGGVAVHTVSLLPLDLEDVVRLCADSLNCRESEAASLARLVFEKTGGNPFFLKQFLQHLASRDALTFDYTSGVWQWNTERIGHMAITDNVVDLMIKRIRELPTPTRDMLKLAACLGNRFSRKILALISGNTSEYVGGQLQDALSEEIIVPIDMGARTLESVRGKVRESVRGKVRPDAGYRFLHDRVQEAAYSLIPETERKDVHLRIGRALERGMQKDESETALFDIVNHLNIGAELMENPAERNGLARLNLRAGTKAKASTAYADAGRFLRTGMALLAPDSWQSEYDLTLTLYTESVEAEYLNTDFEAARELSDVVVAQSRDILDEVRVHVTRVEYLITQNRMVEALDVALPVLERLGYPVSPAVVELRFADRFREVDDLNDMPTMSDPGQLAAVRLLSIITGAAYQGKPEMMLPITVRLVDLCLENGLSPLAAYAYGLYGWLLVGFLNDIDKGYRVGEVALRILEHFGANEYACKTHFIFDTFIRHWKEPHRDSMRTYSDTVQMGLDTGDFVYVAYMRIWSSGYLLMTGHELDYVEQQQRQFEMLMAKLKQENGLYPARIWRQLTLNLQGVSDDGSGYFGDSFSREDMRVVEEMNVPLTLFFAHFVRLIQTYVYCDFTAAMAHADRLRSYEDVVPSSMLLGAYVYYDALASLANYPTMDSRKRREILARVDGQLDRLRRWKRHAPANFRSKVALVEAERARVVGRSDDAYPLYDRACDLAEEDGFPQERALAAERAYQFHAENGHPRIAGVYLQEAFDAYARWGAIGKTEVMAKEHPEIPSPQSDKIRKVVPVEENHPPKGTLDFMTLIKASQALSSEIEYDTLLAKLLQLAIENAGAKRGVLVVDREGELRVVAEVAGDDEKARMLPSLPVDGDTALPSAVVRLVARTRQTVVIGDAMEDATFSRNPYVLAKKPKSVLCMPICRGKEVVAILYLENDLGANVFTSESLDLLNVLLSQAAISLDNAGLFAQKTKAERDMRRLRNYLSNIIDSMPSVLIGVDVDGRVTLWNGEAARATGLSVERAVGQPLSHAFPRLSGEMDRVREAMRTRQARIDARRPRKTGGETRYEDVTVYPLATDGAVIRVDDVTERVRIEEIVVQSEKMLSVGGLAAGMAHEINNPLGGMMQTASVMRSRLTNLELPANVQAAAESGTTMEAIARFMEKRDIFDMLRRIRESGIRAADIVANMLSFARKSDSAFSSHNLAELLDQCLDLAGADYDLKKKYDFRQIKIVREYEADLPPVFCEAGKIQQVFLNILRNGAEAMHDAAVEGPQFNLRLAHEAERDMVCIEFQDNGPGMAEKTRKRAFEPFFTTKPTDQGTGLGLSVSYFIITESHNGEMAVDSQPGKGTKFSIRLPVGRREP